MYRYGKYSRARLITCHPDLQKLFWEVIKEIDTTIVCGHRDEEAQNDAYEEKKSKLRFPESKHNYYPSMAVDAAPYCSKIKGIPWNDIEAFKSFAKIVFKKADELNLKVRWGGDWDGDKDLSDQTFNDYPHFELME